MANINLSGSISTTGVAILGSVTVEITSNTDLTLTVAQYTNQFIHVTSDGNSTAQRNVIAPLVAGQVFIVQNATTEGYPIQFIGSSGNGVVIATNQVVSVVTDGVNYYTLQDGIFAGPTTPPGNGSWSQATWYIDPINGNDSNNGSTSVTALKTKRELLRRWGTESPVLMQPVTINYLNPDTNDSDPGIFTPIFVGGSLTHTAPLPAASFTGTLATVTAKNQTISGNNGLQVTFTTATGAMADGLMLVNSTHNSRAFAVRVATGVWYISQPLGPYTPGTHPIINPQVNTWAPGDVIDGYALTNVNIARVGGQVVDGISGFLNFHQVYQLTVWDPGPNAFDCLIVDSECYPVFMECAITRSLNQSRCAGGLAFYENVYFNAGIFNVNAMLQGRYQDSTTNWFAGSIACFGESAIRGMQIGYDVMVSCANGTLLFEHCEFTGGVLLDPAPGSSTISTIGGGALEYIIYGGTGLNVVEGTLIYSGTATNSLPVASLGGLFLNGQSTAYSAFSVGGATSIFGGIPLTVANIDATAGATGFGGTATSLAGAAISNGNQPSFTTNPSWLVANWYIDPSNSTTNASDSNNGTSASTPLLTFAELVRRWGTNSPIHAQQTTVEFLSSQTTAADPVVWNPIVLNGDIAVLQGTLTQVQTGTLSGVIPKNRSTPQLLQVTLGAGLSEGLLIQDTTNPGQAILYKNVSGNNWELSQPLSVATIPPSFGTSEVNSWANGDGYVIYSYPTVNVVSFNPVLQDLVNFSGLQQLVVASPGGTGFEQLYVGANVQIQNATINKNIADAGSSIILTRLINVWLEAENVEGAESSYFGIQALGGIVFNLIATGVHVDFDTIITGTVNEWAGACSWGTAYLESTSVLQLIGGCSFAAAHGAANVTLWGTGTINVFLGTLYAASGGTFSEQIVGPTLQFAGISTGYSLLNVGGATSIFGSIPLTPANLDAAVGATGFGGTATNFAGSAITNSTQPVFTTNPSWSVTNWYIDPINGNDLNNGTTSVTALATKAELARRWGGWSPVLNDITVTITYLNPDTTANDPGLFTPFLVNGASLVHTASLPLPSFTGTLNVVTPKNRANNQILQTTFNTTTGAMAASLLLVNTTRGNSRAFAQRNTSGSTWQITQPMTPFAGPGNVYSSTEVDTWASGDAIDGYALLEVNLTTIGGQLVDWNIPDNAANYHLVYQLAIYQPTETFTAPFLYDCAAYPALVECSVNRFMQIYGNAYQSDVLTAIIANSNQTFLFIPANMAGGNVYIIAGCLGGGIQCPGGVPVFSYDTIIARETSFFDTGFGIYFGGLAIDTSSLIYLTGANGLTEAPIYGPGAIDVECGWLQNATGSTATFAFPIGNGSAGGGGITLQGKSTAYSLLNANGTVTVYGGIALTPANIDAIAGANGFGGQATNLASASVGNGTQPLNNSSWTVTSWYIDPVNGSDTNTGITSGSPLRTKAELVRRWGTNSPVLTVAVTITYLNSDTTNADPGIFTPIINGGSLTHIGELPAPGFTGTLNVVTPKNRASNQALETTFNTTTGAIAANMLLVNTTRGNSRAWVYRLVSGSTYMISQPCAPYSGTGLPSIPPTEVDTWASGDSIDGYVLPNVYLAKIGGQLVASTSVTLSFHAVYQLNIWGLASTEIEGLQVDTACEAYFVECGISRPLCQSGNAYLTLYDNVNIAGTYLRLSAGITDTWGDSQTNIWSGIINISNGDAALSGFVIGNDIIYSGTGFDQWQNYVVEEGGVYFDNGFGATQVSLGSGRSASAVFYGTLALNVYGTLIYNNTAVSTFPTSGGLQLAGQSSAYSIATTSGITALYGGISLTAANIDAASGPSGFGGTATNLSGASITKINTAIVTDTPFTIGNVLQASSTSALEYAPINLAGGSTYVTGINTTVVSSGSTTLSERWSQSVIISGTNVTINFPSSPSNGDMITIRLLGADGYGGVISGDGYNVEVPNNMGTFLSQVNIGSGPVLYTYQFSSTENEWILVANSVFNRIICPWTSIYVDPSNSTSNANDQTPNPTSSEPIQSIAELNRRLFNNDITSSTTITFLSDVTTNDVLLDLSSVRVYGAGVFILQGTPQVLHSGTTFTSTVTINPTAAGGGQAQTVTDTALGSFASYAGNLIKDITSGAYAWITPNGTTTVDTSRPMSANSLSTGTFTSGDSYQIQRPSKIGVLSFPLIFENGSANIGLQVNDLMFVTTPSAPTFISSTFSTWFTIFLRCSFPGSADFWATDNAELHNCYTGGLVSVDAGIVSFKAGLWVTPEALGYSENSIMGWCWFDADTYVTGAGISLGANQEGNTFNNVLLNPTTPGTSGVQFQVCSTDGITINLGGNMTVNGLIWGNRNDGYGIRIGLGSSLKVLSADLPSVTGTSGDFVFDIANGSSVPGSTAYQIGVTGGNVTATSTTCSWSNFSGLSGGQNLQRPDANSALVAY